MVQAVPASMSSALARKSYFFVPLALAEGRGGEAAGHRKGNEATLISPEYTTDLADQAICHRNVSLGTSDDDGEGVFISSRLLNDRFSLAFEFFINVGHAFVDEAGVAGASRNWRGTRPSQTCAERPAKMRGRDRAAALGAGDGMTQDGKRAASMRRPRRIFWRLRSRTRWRFTCCRCRLTSTTRSCGSGSILCSRRSLWRSGCVWWRSCFRRMRTMSLRSGIAGGLNFLSADLQPAEGFGRENLGLRPRLRCI